MTKLLKDHGMLPVYLSKDELGVLFKLVNVKMGNRQETQSVDYLSYLQMIPQVSFLSFSRPPKDLSFMPLVESLLTLLLIFRESAKAKGQSMILYEDPDLAYQTADDLQLIKALNDKLKKDPNYPIPEGFIKVTEKTPVYEYKVPADIAAKISESKVIAVELLDELVNGTVGFHFLEPMVSFEDYPKVKSMVSAIKPQQAEALNLMKKAALGKNKLPQSV
jgi:hypothetical protein